MTADPEIAKKIDEYKSQCDDKLKMLKKKDAFVDKVSEAIRNERPCMS